MSFCSVTSGTGSDDNQHSPPPMVECVGEVKYAIQEIKSQEYGFDASKPLQIAYFAAARSCATSEPAPLRIAIISDTYGNHRSLTIPDNIDVLIHAGDFTLYGKLSDAVDFNNWLGSLTSVPAKIDVNGNHECNSHWKSIAMSILSNAIFLQDEDQIIAKISSEGMLDTGSNILSS